MTGTYCYGDQRDTCGVGLAIVVLLVLLVVFVFGLLFAEVA